VDDKMLGSENHSGWNLHRILHASRLEYLGSTIRGIFSY